MPTSASRPCITVLAGTNGAGKSSIAGARLRHSGGEYFNPDEAARRFREVDPSLSQAQANGLAWNRGVELLTQAIRERKIYFFETTLGGTTITRLLEDALDSGLDVRVWYAGLATPELHIQRVQSRVAHGGHDIPEAAIRRRYTQSIENLIQLLPRLTELSVFDNTESGDPKQGHPPRPRLILHMKQQRIIAPGLNELRETPHWAKPIVATALTVASGS